MRTPGDSLRVSLARDSLVFAPGEVLKCTLEPHALALGRRWPGADQVQLLGSGGKELWSQQHDVQAGHEAKIPLEIALPGEEGVYDVVDRGREQSELVAGGPPAVELEADDRRAAGATAGARARSGRPAPRADREFTQVVEIDPANPRWFEKLNKLPQLQLTKTRLPRLWKGPLGNDCLQTQPHALGDLVAVEPQRRLARRELGGLLAADQLSPAGRTSWKWTIPATCRRPWASASWSPTPPGR